LTETSAISAAQGLRRPGLEGIGLVALGWAYQSQGRFDEASTSFARVLELARAEPDRFAGRRGSPPLSVMALVWLATLRGEQGDFGAGHVFASDAVRMAEDANHPWSRAAAYFGLGALLIAERKAGSAIPVLERGLRLCESNNISSWRTTIAWHLGYARACEHDLEGGIPLLEESVRKAEADRCFAGQSMRLGWLAEAFMFANNLERASKLALEALSTAVTHGELPAQAHIHRILGDIDFARQSEGSSTAIKHYVDRDMPYCDRLLPSCARCKKNGTLKLAKQPGVASQQRQPSLQLVDDGWNLLFVSRCDLDQRS
jgi:tetratricopeptide (TPR) repeat protein